MLDIVIKCPKEFLNIFSDGEHPTLENFIWHMGAGIGDHLGIIRWHGNVNIDAVEVVVWTRGVHCAIEVQYTTLVVVPDTDGLVVDAINATFLSGVFKQNRPMPITWSIRINGADGALRHYGIEDRYKLRGKTHVS